MRYDATLINLGITLTTPMPSKPLVLGVDGKKLSLKTGEDEEQFLNVLLKIGDLAQAFKFLPKYDQMRYQYSSPLMLYKADPQAFKDYVASLTEGMPQADKDRYMAYCNDLISLPANDPARLDAAYELKNLENTVLSSTYSKQMETRTLSCSLTYNGTNIYDLGREYLVEGSGKVYVNGVVADPANYTIDYAAGQIIFSDGILAEGSEIKVDYEYKLASIRGQGMGIGYSNLEFSPDANEWDMIPGDDIDSSGTSFLADFDGDGDGASDLSNFFDLNGILCDSKWTGMSYYDIAKSGMVDSTDFSDQDAFYLMCSMLESRERVFRTLREIFGDASELGAGDVDNNGVDDVIDNITSFLDQYTEVDPHNIGILKMFFGMQTDLVNTLDAFINCQTYWGLDPTLGGSDLGGFANTLMSKVNSYISNGLSGDLTDAIYDAKDAAKDLEDLWFNLDNDGNPSPLKRWDRVNGEWAAGLAKTDGSWVKFFQDAMDNFNNEEVIRLVTCRILSRSGKRQYDVKMVKYESEKDFEIERAKWLQKVAAKNTSQNRKTYKKSVGRRVNVSNVLRKRSGNIKMKPARAHQFRPRPVAKPKPKPPVNTGASSAMAGIKNAINRAVAKPKVNSVAGGMNASAAVKSHQRNNNNKQSNQAPKKGHSEDKNKVA